MDRRTWLAGSLSLLTVPRAVEAQEAGKVPRVALLLVAPPAGQIMGPVPKHVNTRAFLEALRELGWVDGQNVKIERRSAEGRTDRNLELAQEMARLRVAAMVTVGNSMARAAREANPTIPIIMATSSTPVEAGLVTSYARPGWNITGLTLELSANLVGKRLVLLKEVSGAFRPGVLTALMGVSGAGKTTLLDVLAGRKNSGYIEGNITVSGYPKKQETFARVTGYCEQNDIHSAMVTVYESILYSAWLRLPAEVEPKTREVSKIKF